MSSDVGSVKNKGANLPKRVSLDKNGRAVSKEAKQMSSWLVMKEGTGEKKKENGDETKKVDDVTKVKKEENSDADEESPSKKPKK